MTTLTLYVGNDNLIELDSLTDESDSSYLNAATVQATLQDASGDNVSGQSWPTTLSYVAASDGKYQGIIDDTAALTAGHRYTAIVTADEGAGKHGRWELPVVAQTRTA